MQKIPIILTRPSGSNDGFVSQISPDIASQLECITSPLITIEALNTAVQLPEDAEAIFTSSNGIGFAPSAEGRTAFCVGTATTERAQAAGWHAICAGRNVAEMIGFFEQNPPNGRIFHLGGQHVRGDVTGKLREMGLIAEHVTLYDQRLLPLTSQALTVLQQNRPVIVPLFSPRAASHFAATAPPNPQLRLVTLSAAVTESARKMPIHQTYTAPVPTREALVACIEKAVQDISLG